MSSELPIISTTAWKIAKAKFAQLPNLGNVIRY